MDEEAIKKMLGEILSEGLEAKLAPVVSEKVDAALKEMGVEKSEDGKWKGFPGVAAVAPELAATEAKEKAANFIKAVYKKEESTIKGIMEAEMEAKGMNTLVDSEGGFFVPEELGSEIVRIAEDFGYARKFARPFKLSGPRSVNREGSSVSVSWVGETQAGTESQPSIEKVKLEPKTLMGLSVESNELLADANVDVVEYLIELFAEAFAGEEDNQAFNGVGTPFTGILNHSDVTDVVMATGNTSFVDVTINNLIDMRSQPKSSVLPTCAYYMHRTVWGEILKLTENSRHVTTYVNPQVVAKGPQALAPLSPVGAIDQYPVLLSDKMPAVADTAVSTPFVIFGSMKRALFFGDRQQISMSTTKEGSIGGVSMFETNQTALRMTERVSIVVGLPAAMVRLTTSAT